MAGDSMKSEVQKLRDRGFDLSKYNGDGSWLVRCSQCEALVINHTATHEAGCPNTPKYGQDGDWT